MNVDWENVPVYLEGNRDWYYEIQEAYRKEIGEIYTQVPEGEFFRLKDLCEGKTPGSSEEATALILSALGGMEYTRTPGGIPVNRDPVEYFLFESGQGYCQHFASAAVLMYRLYGIPARYAVGYRIPPSMFSRQEDGSWRAVVTDESAHAWPEIFLEDYGWVPVEVTFSGSDVPLEYPGMDAAVLEGMLEETGGETTAFPKAEEDRTSVLNDESEANDAPPENLSSEEDAFGGSGGVRKTESERALAGAVVCLLCFAALAFRYYREYRLCLLETAAVPELYYKLVKAVHFAGFLREYEGSEREFPEKLPQVVPGLTKEQARELYAIAGEAAFGKEPVEAERKEAARELYKKIVRSLYRGLPLYKKAIFQSIRSWMML